MAKLETLQILLLFLLTQIKLHIFVCKYICTTANIYIYIILYIYLYVERERGNPTLILLTQIRLHRNIFDSSSQKYDNIRWSLYHCKYSVGIRRLAVSRVGVQGKWQG